MIKVQISGLKDVKEVLLKLKQKLSDFRPGMQIMGKEILGSIDKNYQTEGSYLGKPWEPLAPYTVMERASKGYGAAHPILQRTGRMRRGYKALVSKKKLNIINVVPYLEQHELGKGIVPKRVTMRLNEKLTDELVNLAAEYLYGDL